MQKISTSQRFSLDLVDVDAQKVIRRLRQFGYEAYLVGGSVRDLWLGRTPKDFDIATDASPRQVKRVFGNSRLIGRRFRLAHVFFGSKIMEVSTFRSNIIAHHPDDTVGDEGEERDLLIRDDNVFGNAEEDAVRRDFTINGLFFDPETEEVIDYVDGARDLDRRILRTIGDADVRMQEDPVRILRAIKFAARLDFDIDETTWAAMMRYKEEVLRCSPARVHEEVMRLLGSGSAEPSMRLMWQSGVLAVLLPELAAYLDSHADDEACPLWAYLQGLDRLNRKARPVSAALLIGATFWPVIQERMQGPELDPLDFGRRVEKAVDDVTGFLRLPKRERALLKQVLTAQRRLNPPAGTRRRKGAIYKMATKSYYPAAVAFCEIEMRAGGKSDEEVAEWESQLEIQPEQPEAAGDKKPRKRRRRRRRGEPGDAKTGASNPDNADDASRQG